MAKPLGLNDDGMTEFESVGVRVFVIEESLLCGLVVATNEVVDDAS